MSVIKCSYSFWMFLLCFQCVCAMACTSQCGRRRGSRCSSSPWSCPASTRRPPPRLRWCSGGTSPTAETARGTPSPCPRAWASRPPSWAPRPTWSAPTAAARCGWWPRRRDSRWLWPSTTKAETSPSWTVKSSFFFFNPLSNGSIKQKEPRHLFDHKSQESERSSVSCSPNKPLLSLSHNGAEQHTHTQSHTVTTPCFHSYSCLSPVLNLKPYQAETLVLLLNVSVERNTNNNVLLSSWSKVQK